MKQCKVHLVFGGTKSGKSLYAQKQAEKTSSSLLYVATCPRIEEDKDLAQRILAHQTSRLHWDTIEEQMHLKELMESPKIEKYDCILIDCIGLWVNNLLYYKKNKTLPFYENYLKENIREICARARKRDINLFIVSNEVGCSVTPDNKLSRYFTDLVGGANQILALHSDEVTFLRAGIPQNLKK